jgi:VanZ family protein
MCFIAWGGVIELIQPYVNRHASLLDLAANTAGIAFGLLAVKLNFSDKQYELDHGSGAV